MKKWIIITLIILLLGLVALGVISSDRIDNNNIANFSTSDESSITSIFVEDQDAMDSVRIDNAVLDQSGFIIIHEDSSGAPGRIIGVSNLLEPGNYSNIEIYLSRKIEGGERLYAMLHRDSGDGVFNPRQDTPVVNMDDNIVLSDFNVFVE